ncbi:MAG TPA: nucleoside monophosphate kinase [Bacilli bacterium]|nr:nucleoside monophosphate kinase [Bacilli bacterium]
MKNVIFVAPPAAGKGTQSEMLVAKYGYAHISTGELLREVRSEGTERAQTIIEYQDKGILVPDEIVVDLLKERLLKHDVAEKGYILDGYPRTLAQAKILTDMLAEIGSKDYVVIFLDIDYDQAMQRTLGRRSCPSCNAIYNIFFDQLKPKVDNVCDNCQAALIQRSDDNEETFKVRFEAMSCKDVVDYYQEIGKLQKIKVDADAPEIFARIEKLLSSD